MIVYRKLVRKLKFVILLIVFSYMIYWLLTLASSWVEPSRKYRTPLGGAVKVFQPEVIGYQSTMADRLRFFYWLGGE